MAFLHDGGSSRTRAAGRSARPRSRSYVDMTAMVDVAFLLLTFFVLSAVIDKDYIMKFVVPPDETARVPQAAEQVMSIVLGAGNAAWYFTGVEPDSIHTARVGSDQLRRDLFSHLQTHPKASILIKPQANSHYGTLVNMLDELLINRAKRYALAPFTEADSLLILSIP